MVQQLKTSPGARAWLRFCSDPLAVVGGIAVLLLLLLALLAPFLANARPFLLWKTTADGALESWEMPFLRYFFAPDSTEYLIEQFFNYLLLMSVVFLISRLFRGTDWRRRKRIRMIFLGSFALLLLIPFCVVKGRLDRTDFRSMAAQDEQIHAVFAPIPYGPYEQIGTASAAPGAGHWLGCDPLGRDMAARLIYGARVSLAVGIFATLLTMLIGMATGVAAGYWGGWADLALMRLVEILLCFPVFLLLLILMAILKDHKFEQSILVVIAVIAATGWIGIAQLARGEVLKQRSLTYIKSVEAIGVPGWRIMYFHLLPNILPPLLIAFSFGVAGAILSESGLSFLGFGVQPPTASWGGMLRMAIDTPMNAWHLMVFPGFMLFYAVAAFNFMGEGLRKALDPR